MTVATSLRRQPGCPLCDGDGGQLVWRNAQLRVILPDEADYPGFVRVILDEHITEMTDLSPLRREHVMQAVWIVEACIREVMQPDKVNLASLGNMVAHVHWHVIARWRDDRHFPGSVWSVAQREADPARRRERVDALRERLVERLATLTLNEPD